MTTSNHIRILKADDVAHHAVVTLPRPNADVGHPGVTTHPRPVAVEPEADLTVVIEQARAQGAADAARELEPSLRQLAGALSSLSEQSAAAQAAALRADSESIIETALAVANWILDRELGDPEAVLDLARRALADAGDPKPVRLRVHPHLVDALTELAPEATTIVGDGGLAPGEFVTETAGPDIAFRFERALDRARRALHDDHDPREETAPDEERSAS